MCLADLHVSKLKGIARMRCINLQGCLEKEDIVAALHAAGVDDKVAQQEAAPSSASSPKEEEPAAEEPKRKPQTTAERLSASRAAAAAKAAAAAGKAVAGKPRTGIPGGAAPSLAAKAAAAARNRGTNIAQKPGTSCSSCVRFQHEAFILRRENSKLQEENAELRRILGPRAPMNAGTSPGASDGSSPGVAGTGATAKPPPPVPTGGVDLRQTSEICYSWKSSGRCNKGSACKWLHVKPI